MSERTWPLTSVLLCAGLLMLVGFSMPGRTVPSQIGGLDVIALIKLAARCLTLVVVVSALAAASADRREAVVACLVPFGVFVVWAFLSVAWSPLKSISAGQALGLLLLVLSAAAVGSLCRTEADWSRVLLSLSLSLLLVAVIVLIIDRYDRDLSGLNRDNIFEGSIGVIHPTSAGSTAALGILLLVGCRMLWGWPWTRRLLVPGVLAHMAILLLANSRTATGFLLVALAIGLAWWNPRLVAAGVLAGCVVVTIGLVIDPRLELFDRAAGDAAGYVSRGESPELLMSLTGRTTLWDVLWASYLESPWIGHGYFVTSKTGVVDVWHEETNLTAHNTLFQVLVSTGLLGLLLFVLAWIVLLAKLTHSLGRDGPAARLAALLGVIGLWYLGWMQLCESFMGPIQPEAVVFFTLLGLGLSTVPRQPEATA